MSCRTLLPLLLLRLSPAAALQLSAAPAAQRAAASLQVEGVTLVLQETAACILAEWDVGEPARLRSRLDGPSTRGPRMMHDSLDALTEIADSAGVAAALVRIVLHRHDRTLSRRAAAAAEVDYEFVRAYLAQPQTVRAYADALGTSYVSAGRRLRSLVPREERARRSQRNLLPVLPVEATSAVMAAFEASGGDIQAAAAEVERQLSSRKPGKQLSAASARIKAAQILKQEGKGHLQLTRPKHKVAPARTHTRIPAPAPMTAPAH